MADKDYAVPVISVDQPTSESETPSEVQLAEATMPWWKKSVDEIIVALVVGAVCVGAIYFLKAEGAVVATAGVTGLVAYLTKNRGSNE